MHIVKFMVLGICLIVVFAGGMVENRTLFCPGG
jgi:hypothetical protein